MQFILQNPSLQHLALVEIAAALWNQRDIMDRITQITNPPNRVHYIERDGEWMAIEDQVKNNAWALPLPAPCKKRLQNFIQPMGMEIINWRDYHNVELYNFQVEKNVLPLQFCWTRHGSIDYAKMAKLMMKDERLSVERRFEFATINGLEDEAGELFRSLAEPLRRKYVRRVRRDECILSIRHQDQIAYFICTLSGVALHSHPHFHTLLSRGSVNQFLFEDAVQGGSPAACEYWFEKLVPQERNRVLSEARELILEPPTCSSLYYLSLMNEEQQRLVFREHSADVLQCLLTWPMQSLFLEAAQCGLPFLSEEKFNEVLYALSEKIRLGLQDYDYLELFWEFWRLSPAAYQQQFLNDTWYSRKLLETKDEEIIKLVSNSNRLR